MIAELIRAHNDVPAEWLADAPNRTRVLFYGQDGVIFVQTDHPEFARIRSVFVDAIRQQSRVWFIARREDLAVMDVLTVEIKVVSFAQHNTLPIE